MQNRSPNADRADAGPRRLVMTTAQDQPDQLTLAMAITTYGLSASHKFKESSPAVVAPHRPDRR